MNFSRLGSKSRKPFDTFPSNWLLYFIIPFKYEVLWFSVIQFVSFGNSCYKQMERKFFFRREHPVMFLVNNKNIERKVYKWSRISFGKFVYCTVESNILNPVLAPCRNKGCGVLL